VVAAKESRRVERNTEIVWCHRVEGKAKAPVRSHDAARGRQALEYSAALEQMQRGTVTGSVASEVAQVAAVAWYVRAKCHASRFLSTTAAVVRQA
jgi:hypothetical protein